MVSALHGVGHFRARDGEADGRAVAEAFGAGDDVGRDALLLDAEPLAAGAAPAGLHFIADEDAAVVAHDLVDDLEIFLGRRDESADALDGLGDEAGDAAAGGWCGSDLPCPARSGLRNWDKSDREGSGSSRR